ncbi:MAG TPA: cysteine desulfurase [Pirellulaceae bacterium]|nr:cysteine desulfurase [Pirellulaceae bacterium]
MSQRIYLDNAATSWPKPEAVYRSVDVCQRRLGAPAGRGAYAEASEVERTVASCRKKIAQLIGAADPSRIILTQNGTDSLNLAIHGWLRPGDHVVTTVCEHNSVLRPLRFLAEHREVTTTCVGCDSHGVVDPEGIRRAIQPNTRMIALIHASNVTGAIQPVEEVGRIAAERGITYLVDAAQTLGHEPVDVRRIGCQLLAAPGHKGLLGPLGTGVLYIAPGIDDRLLPLRQGGTGTRSDEDVQPSSLPDRYESGNLNVPGIVGLEAGVTEILTRGIEAIRQHSQELVSRLIDGLREIPGITLYGSLTAHQRAGIVSLNVAGYDPQELASLLDSQWSIQTRAGLHCAPRMHASLGTSPGGTLRLSVGPYNTPEQIEALAAALSEIAQ